jgi:phosphohistidine swiveling domain-containing protein
MDVVALLKSLPVTEIAANLFYLISTATVVTVAAEKGVVWALGKVAVAKSTAKATESTLDDKVLEGVEKAGNKALAVLHALSVLAEALLAVAQPLSVYKPKR